MITSPTGDHITYMGTTNQNQHAGKIRREKITGLATKDGLSGTFSLETLSVVIHALLGKPSSSFILTSSPWGSLEEKQCHFRSKLSAPTHCHFAHGIPAAYSQIHAVSVAYNSLKYTDITLSNALSFCTWDFSSLLSNPCSFSGIK